MRRRFNKIWKINDVYNKVQYADIGDQQWINANNGKFFLISDPVHGLDDFERIGFTEAPLDFIFYNMTAGYNFAGKKICYRKHTANRAAGPLISTKNKTQI